MFGLLRLELDMIQNCGVGPTKFAVSLFFLFSLDFNPDASEKLESYEKNGPGNYPASD